MGGPGSTRWGMTLTRQTTDGLPRLDVRELARAGGLIPGMHVTVEWPEAATLALRYPRSGPARLLLAYQIGILSGAWRSVQEAIHLNTTPCTFGGTRTWFACPRCGRRCAILYACAGVFHCRACHRLAYPSTR